MKPLTLAAVLLLSTAAQAGGPTVRYRLWYTPRGNCYVVAPYDEQAKRKIAQGNYGALGVQTRGLTHATGAYSIGNRIFLGVVD